MNLKQANECVKDVQETVFDEFKLALNTKTVGRGLRTDLTEIFNKYGRINELTSSALFHLEKAKSRLDKVKAIAYKKVYSDPANKALKVEDRKNLVKVTVVEIDGTSTTPNDEEERVSVYNFLYNRGRDKQKEIAALLDLGRTILSFDKTELERVG